MGSHTIQWHTSTPRTKSNPFQLNFPLRCRDCPNGYHSRVLKLVILAQLCIREVHLRMLCLELLQHFQLLLLITRRLSHLLLPLIIHHLLHHGPRLAVQVAELAALRLDLGGVDLGGTGDDMCPPLHLVDLVEMDADLLAVRHCLERPGGLVDVDGVW